MPETARLKDYTVRIDGKTYPVEWVLLGANMGQPAVRLPFTVRHGRGATALVTLEKDGYPFGQFTSELLATWVRTELWTICLLPPGSVNADTGFEFSSVEEADRWLESNAMTF